MNYLPRFIKNFKILSVEITKTDFIGPMKWGDNVNHVEGHVGLEKSSKFLMTYMKLVTN